ncbi:MAG TPA: dihydrodipicolinate synthase family protein [Mobilitalea sp.]|nr:dihydrodipicolinate synthase family protein [Mobilitalea sp.]
MIDTILPEFPDFEIYSGYDDYFARNVLSGGSGAIGGLTNIAPEIGSGWVKAFKENDIEKISYYQKQMDNLASLFDFGVPFVPLVKKAMVLKGLPMEDICMPPLKEPTKEHIELIRDILNKISKI